MKKTISLILSAILVLSLIVMSGCGDSNSTTAALDPAKAIIGTWDAEVDFTDYFTRILEESSEIEDIDIDDVKLSVVFTFKDDNTYTIKLNEDKIDDELEDLASKLRDWFIEYLEKYIEENDLGVSVDELFEAMNTTKEEFLEENFNAETFKSGMGEVSGKGKYEVKDDKIYTTDDEDDEFDEDNYTTFEMKSDKELKLLKDYGDDEDTSNMMYPITLYKR